MKSTDLALQESFRSSQILYRDHCHKSDVVMARGVVPNSIKVETSLL
jgi:hypothetical protein